MKRLLFIFFLMTFVSLSGVSSNSYAQLKNPLLEFCTGTWCQWCPCGDVTIEDLLVTYPNLIPLAYHGPVGSDPYANFPGNEILGLMGLSAYPNATVNRASAPSSYTSWTSKVSSQANEIATVSIDVQRTFEQSTGRLEATVDMTALENLTGQYKYNVVLTEDSLIYNQVNNGNCVSGGPNWVHYWVVRAMINGASGEDVNTGGDWGNGEMISKTVSYTVPSEYNPEKCHIIVFVYKQNSPMYLAEVQQAEKYTLIPPDYVATASQTSPDVIADNSTVADFDVVIHNVGIQNDKYDIDLSFDGPSGWGVEYTDENGTFAMGQTDSVEVASGDSTLVTVHVDPSGIDGYGVTSLNYTSRHAPTTNGSVELRNVTTTGVNMLVIDANDGEYEAYIDSSVQRVYTGSYGLVSRNSLISPTADLTHFYTVIWSSGTTKPVFYPQDVDALQSFLDASGNLLINGQDIGSDIFKPTGQSQFAQDFYHNYLHADFVKDTANGFIINGIAGDPIGDGINFILYSTVHPRSHDQISAHDADATPILQVGTSGSIIVGLKADPGDYRVVYSTVGLEQIPYVTRDTIIARSIRWLMENVVVGNKDTRKIQPRTYSLEQNYPNPFNPTTRIKYSIPQASQTSLKIYDILGNEVAELVNQEKPAGTYEVEFNASSLSSGVYFYKLKSGSFIQTKKMVILK